MAGIEEMKLEVRKLDGRNTGHTYFKYYARPFADYSHYKNRVVDNYFFEMRDWCWQTWGGSKELDEWLNDQNFTISNIALNRIHETKCQNVNWCWKNDRDAAHRIYLKSDQELVLFKLRWE